MAAHRQNGFEQPRDDARYAAGQRGAAWSIKPARPGRANSPHRQPPAEAVCQDCSGTGLRAASLDPYCSCVLTCRTCEGTNTHQDRTIFLMQLAFGCGIGLATLAVVLL